MQATLRKPPLRSPRQAVPAAAVSPPAQTEALPTDPKKINVDLSATEATWVSLSSAGRTVFAGILDASQTKNFDLSESAKLLTGNAAGLDVRMNGRPIGPIGQRGQVRVVVFSARPLRNIIAAQNVRVLRLFQHNCDELVHT